jgi:glycosyltransferase involved in cell wall biosynthesis
MTSSPRMAEELPLVSHCREPGESRSVRIANVLFDDRFGGPPKRVVLVARRLERDGIQTVLYVPDGNGNVVELARAAGVDTRRVRFQRMPKPRHLRGIVRWLCGLPGDIARFIAVFRDEAPALVHVNGAFFVAPAVAAKILRLPLVWHLNDTSVGWPVALLLGVVVRMLADRVVVAAEAVASHYGVAGAEHHVVYAPVQVEQFENLPTARGEAPASAMRLGLVANWNPTKGIEHFVRACALLRRTCGTRLEMVFAGARLTTQADYGREIDDLIDALGLRPSVRDLGFVSDIPTVMSEIDVLVLSSTAEACPMVVLEAMAAGVPVVATDVGGVRELLRPGTADEAGLVVPPRDPSAIAWAVQRVFDAPGVARRLAQNGYRAARERFGLESCAVKHRDIYVTLLRDHRRRHAWRRHGQWHAS